MKNLLFLSLAFLLLGACKKKQKSDASVPPGISIDRTDIKILPEETQLSQEGIIGIAEQSLFSVTPPTSVDIVAGLRSVNDTSYYRLVIPTTLLPRVVGNKTTKKAVRLKLKINGPVYYLVMRFYRYPYISSTMDRNPYLTRYLFGLIQENQKQEVGLVRERSVIQTIQPGASNYYLFIRDTAENPTFLHGGYCLMTYLTAKPPQKLLEIRGEQPTEKEQEEFREFLRKHRKVIKINLSSA